MTTTIKSMSIIMAVVVTVLYFWYLGYNVMIMDNPILMEQRLSPNYISYTVDHRDIN